jgi:hypothetical protein
LYALSWQLVKREERPGVRQGTTVISTASASRRALVWESYGAPRFPLLAKVAKRTLAMHATSCASERNWSLWGSVYTKARNQLAIERAAKLIYIRENCGAAVTPADDEDEVIMELLGE